MYTSARIRWIGNQQIYIFVQLNERKSWTKHILLVDLWLDECVCVCVVQLATMYGYNFFVEEQLEIQFALNIRSLFMFLSVWRACVCVRSPFETEWNKFAQQKTVAITGKQQQLNSKQPFVLNTVCCVYVKREKESAVEHFELSRSAFFLVWFSFNSKKKFFFYRNHNCSFFFRFFCPPFSFKFIVCFAKQRNL